MPSSVTQMKQDSLELERLLELFLHDAFAFHSTLENRPVALDAVNTSLPPIQDLPKTAEGAEKALNYFREHYAESMSGSAGSRYFGFVTGGVTPASLLGDWLTSLFDNNAFGVDDSIVYRIELEAISMLRSLFNLSDTHTGSFVTGATMSNFVGLAIARQWVGQELGVDIAVDGIAALGTIPVLSAAPHSSIYKALSMLGMGRNCVQKIETVQATETIDVNALEEVLVALDGKPCIVVATAGTVNAVEYDDLAAIAALKEHFKFWLHIDAAFGAFAACTTEHKHLVAALDAGDSICIDAHKFLNVPYDAAMQFTKHLELQAQVFSNAAVYIHQEVSPTSFINLTPENSRRCRALASWFSLLAYGQEGYQQMVEQCCANAQLLAEKIEASEHFKLLAPVQLNGICFTFEKETSLNDIRAYLTRLQTDGRVFLTPTSYLGTPAIRVSITNWRTEAKDIDIAWDAMLEVLDS